MLIQHYVVLIPSLTYSLPLFSYLPILLPLLFPRAPFSFLPLSPSLPSHPSFPSSLLPSSKYKARYDITPTFRLQPRHTICMHNRFTIVNCQNYSFTQCLNVFMNSVRVNVVMNGFCCCLIEGYEPARNHTTCNQLPGSFCSSEVCLQLITHDFSWISKPNS